MRLSKNTQLYLVFSIFFTLVFLIPYIILPYIFVYGSFPVFVGKLAKLTIIGVVSYLLALNFSFGFSIKLSKLIISFDFAIYALFTLFILFILLTFATAPRIPIIESLKGASENDLVQYREDVFKSRHGWASFFGYLGDILSAYFMPYFIGLAFLKTIGISWFLLVFFFFNRYRMYDFENK